VRSNSLFALVVVVYALFQFYVYFGLKVYVPDEIIFTQKISELVNLELPKGLFRFWVTQDNHLGYGAIYWVLQAVIVQWSGTVTATRLISYLSVISILIILYVIGKKLKSKYTWESVLLWLTFPMAWWWGKLNGPEYISLVIGFLGVALYLVTRKILWSTMLVGISTGIKLNNVAFLMLPMIMEFWEDMTINRWDWRSGWQKLTKIVLGCLMGLAIGMVVANPIIITNGSQFLSKFKSDSSFTLRHLLYILNGYYWEWDAVFSGGMSYWSLKMTVAVVLVVILVLIRTRKEVVIGVVGVVLAELFLCLKNARFLGWYTFPVVVVIPLLVLHGQKIRHWLVVLFVILNLVTNIGFIYQGWKMKLWHYQNMQKKKEVQACVVKQLESSKIVRVDYTVDYSEIGYYLDLSVVAADKRLQDDVAFNLLVDNQFRPKTAPQSSCLVLVGDRLATLNRFVFFENKEVRNLGRCDFVNLYLVTAKADSITL